MKEKIVAFGLVVALLVLCLLPGLSLAEARYPALRGPVTDDANVLSQGVTADIAALAERVKSRTQVGVYVVIVHFLDGVDAQTYANKLFERWELGADDFLLLGAAGEDAFATASGKGVKKTLNDGGAGLLFTSGFSERFKTQDYDGAFGKYFVGFTQLLNKQYAVDIQLENLFLAYQPGGQNAPRPSQSAPHWSSFVSDMWDGFNEDFSNNARDYDEYQEQRERESRTLTPTGWIVLILLAVLIFGQSDPVRKARKRGGCVGCGCSPVGWLFGIFGLSSLFGRRE